MPLFTEPLNLNDGTTARVFNLTTDSETKDSHVSNRTDLTATLAAADEVIVKQSKNRAQIRCLASKTKSFALGSDVAEEGERGTSTFNLTCNFDSRITEAELQLELNLLIDCAQETNFMRNVIHGMV